MTKEITTIEELKNFANEFATGLKGGDVVGLVGELGAGKTTFTQFLAQALGVTQEVKSPTFVLVREYSTGEVARKRGIRLLVHSDAYRLEDEDELWDIGFDDYVTDLETVSVIEWADKIPSLRDYSTYRELSFGFGPDETRIITIQ